MHPYQEATGYQRLANFERILEDAPATLNAAQLRALLRAIVSLDPYIFAGDVAEHFAGDTDYANRTAEKILLETIDGLADDKLTGFALRLILTTHISIPREDEIDFRSEAATVFAPPQPAKTAIIKKEKKPTPTKAVAKPALDKKAAKKKARA